jgi:phosphoglucomutase
LIIIDSETDLEIGDPDKKPFKIEEIELEKLQENIEKRIKFGIASPSGIRQVFDSTYGDEVTENINGIGTEITDAAKIHIATIADCFSELLREQTSKPYLTVAVAIDSRHTGPAIADIIIRILTFHRISIRYTFITPITELAVYSREVSDGFIYISASHNPKGYNGLKLGLDDGRLLPGKVASAFIERYQSRLKDKKNTLEMIHRTNNADSDKIRDIYESIASYRKESRRIYAEFSDMLVTGIEDSQKAKEQKRILKEEIESKDIWIGVDYNGGARKDREYLESWGFRVFEINYRPRIDMVHDLAPVPEACEQALESLVNLQNEGKNVTAFFVFDTDGDRKNIVIPDGKGKGMLPGVQMIFVLDVLCSILNTQNEQEKIVIVVNDATSSIVEQLAYYLGFRVKRVEVGEANVASAGVNLSKQGICVPIMGEGSNGSVFNLGLLVREPLLTVRTIVDFITKPELTKSLLRQLNREDIYDNWHSSEKIGGLFANIINALPPSCTTDFFTDEGIRKGKHDLPQELFKANFDAYFESTLWRIISDIIISNYDGEPIAEYVNCEGENELRGRGNRKTGTGGYKIEFYVNTKDGKKHHIGWIWFRVSGTERGIMRKGVSISHWKTTPESFEAVNRMYEYLDKIFADALDVVEEETLKGNRL